MFPFYTSCRQFGNLRHITAFFFFCCCCCFWNMSHNPSVNANTSSSMLYSSISLENLGIFLFRLYSVFRSFRQWNDLLSWAEGKKTRRALFWLTRELASSSLFHLRPVTLKWHSIRSLHHWLHAVHQLCRITGYRYVCGCVFEQMATLEKRSLLFMTGLYIGLK